MARIDEVKLSLTVDEARAVYEALGKMTGTDYPGPKLSAAGSDVYDAISRLIPEDD